MQPNYRKIVLSSVLYTLLALIVLFAIFVMLMFFVFTKDLANFMHDMGFNRLSSSLYYRVYEKTGEISYCHKALNIKIILNHNEKIIEYYEAFVEDDEYSDFMSALNENNKNLNCGILEKSTLINEDNYLTNQYVKALIKNGEGERAKTISLQCFENYKNFTLYEQGVYALGQHVSEENKTMFGQAYGSSSNTLIVDMQDYFDLSVLIFNNFNPQNDLDKAYLMSLGNRIISVGQDINKMYDYMNINTDLVGVNQNHMISINNNIKGLI